MWLNCENYGRHARFTAALEGLARQKALKTMVSTIYHCAPARASPPSCLRIRRWIFDEWSEVLNDCLASESLIAQSPWVVFWLTGTLAESDRPPEHIPFAGS